MKFDAEVREEVLEQIWKTVSSEPDCRCWTYLPYDGFHSKQILALNLKHHFNFIDTIHYLIEIDKIIVGWIGLLNIRDQNRVVEIGNVYFSHQMKRTKAATEIIFLLLKLCFEQGYRRIEWKCHELNEPSKKAALRFGFSYEGTFRQDRIAKGRNRNTAWYSMLDEEWPEIEQAYITWLQENNFDENGQQKRKLQEFYK